MKKFIASVLILLCALILFFVVKSHAMKEAYQRDVDVKRLRDIKTLGSMVEEYKRIKGHYPFQKNLSGNSSVQVFFSTSRPNIALYPNVKLVSITDFEKEIEAVLNKDVKVPFEIQRVPNSSRPIYYMYMVDKDYYYVAVHTHNKYSFARKVAPKYYKIEISNEAYPPKKIWTYKQLMNNTEYQKAVSKGIFRDKK